MTEREKVIKGLKWCMNEEHDCYREKGCPYENEGEDVGCKYALHRDALELLKAQEPVMPIRMNYNENKYEIITDARYAKRIYLMSRIIALIADGK